MSSRSPPASSCARCWSRWKNSASRHWRCGYATPVSSEPDLGSVEKPRRYPPAEVRKESGEELTRLEHACTGRSFAQRRDTAIIAVFTATGIRLAELAGLRYDPGDPRRSDIDLWQREITVRGKGGKDRIVRIGHQTARSLDRYLRARSRHPQAWRPQLWLGAGNREPLTAAGIYQMTAPPAAASNAAWTPTRTGSGTTSATPGSTAAAPRET